MPTPRPASSPQPLSSDPIDVLLKHDEWANRRLLEICAALTDEEFDRPFGIGPGSLRATLAHIVTRYYYWSDTIAERTAAQKPNRPALGRNPSAAHLLEALGPAAADLRLVATDALRTGLDKAIKPSWSVAPLLTKGAAIVHVCTHSTHHRAQCLIMLRRLGRHDITAASDNIGTAEWQSEVETRRLPRPKLPAPIPQIPGSTTRSKTRH